MAKNKNSSVISNKLLEELQKIDTSNLSAPVDMNNNEPPALEPVMDNTAPAKPKLNPFEAYQQAETASEQPPMPVTDTEAQKASDEKMIQKIADEKMKNTELAAKGLGAGAALGVALPAAAKNADYLANLAQAAQPLANTLAFPLHVGGKVTQNLAGTQEARDKFSRAGGEGYIDAIPVYATKADLVDNSGMTVMGEDGKPLKEGDLMGYKLPEGQKKVDIFGMPTVSPDQAKMIGNEIGSVATGEGKVGGVADILMKTLGGAVKGVGKGVEGVIKPVTGFVGDVADTAGSLTRTALGDTLTDAIKAALVGKKETPGVGGLLGLAKEAIGQSGYGPGADIISRNLLGQSLYGTSATGGGIDTKAILNGFDREATRISSIPLNRRTAADAKFLESYPENRKTLLAADAQVEDTKAKEAENKQKASGAFGDLTGGMQYNELAKITDYRTKMSKLISEEHRYHDVIAGEISKGDKADKAKITDALERLKSAAGQNSALISQAAGQGAMSQSDKENLDRQNAQIVQIANDTASANALGTGAGLTSFYPIYTKLRGSLAGAMQGQINFLKSTRAPFEAAANLYHPTDEQFKNFTGDSVVEKNVPNYMTAEIDYTGTGDQAKDKSVEQAAMEAELKQLKQAGERTQQAKEAYPGKLDIGSRKSKTPPPKGTNPAGRL